MERGRSPGLDVHLRVCSFGESLKLKERLVGTCPLDMAGQRSSVEADSVGGSGRKCCEEIYLSLWTRRCSHGEESIGKGQRGCERRGVEVWGRSGKFAMWLAS